MANCTNQRQNKMREPILKEIEICGILFKGWENYGFIGNIK